jgi:hypothetical protein
MTSWQVPGGVATAAVCEGSVGHRPYMHDRCVTVSLGMGAQA